LKEEEEEEEEEEAEEEEEGNRFGWGGVCVCGGDHGANQFALAREFVAGNSVSFFLGFVGFWVSGFVPPIKLIDLFLVAQIQCLCVYVEKTSVNFAAFLLDRV
jgi:hypothetical protein